MDTDLFAWEQFLNNHPDAHILQTPAWGRLKAGFGWYTKSLITGDIGSQVLFRKLPLGITVAYIPKGPVGNMASFGAHISELDLLCKRNHAVFLKVEPNYYLEDPTSGQQIASFNEYGSPGKNIQPRRTILVSLSGEPEEWLNRMKQKTRYNIRLAIKKEVEITQSKDLIAFQELMETTGERNEFGVHSIEYYKRAFDEFYPDNVRIFQASYRDKALAAIMVFFRGNLASYFYGASSNQERNRMPTYLLQYEAMKWAAEQGCSQYDLWGIPDEDEETLENNFQDRSDDLWGVYRFKRGFGGAIKRTIPCIDRVYHPFLYKLYLKRIGNHHD